MKHYSDETRGTLQDELGAKQLISFEGMKYVGRHGYKNATPTDIDGFIQLKIEDGFIFFELKRYGNPPNGQKCALMSLVDLADRANANGVLFIAQHNVRKDKTILAKKTIVKQIYWKGKWHNISNGFTLGDYIDKYINYLHTGVDMFEECAS